MPWLEREFIEPNESAVLFQEHRSSSLPCPCEPSYARSLACPPAAHPKRFKGPRELNGLSQATPEHRCLRHYPNAWSVCAAVSPARGASEPRCHVAGRDSRPVGCRACPRLCPKAAAPCAECKVTNARLWPGRPFIEDKGLRSWSQRQDLVIRLPVMLA